VCIINHGGQTEDDNVYRQQGDQWQANSPEAGSQKVNDEIGAHLNLVEQEAAPYESSGRVQLPNIGDVKFPDSDRHLNLGIAACCASWIPH